MDHAAPMTVENAVRVLRSRPECAELVRDAYLGTDVVESARRFEASGEFAEVCRILESFLPAAAVLDIGAGVGIASYAFVRAGGLTGGLLVRGARGSRAGQAPSGHDRRARASPESPCARPARRGCHGSSQITDHALVRSWNSSASHCRVRAGAEAGRRVPGMSRTCGERRP